ADLAAHEGAQHAAGDLLAEGEVYGQEHGEGGDAEAEGEPGQYGPARPAAQVGPGQPRDAAHWAGASPGTDHRRLDSVQGLAAGGEPGRRQPCQAGQSQSDG